MWVPDRTCSAHARAHAVVHADVRESRMRRSLRPSRDTRWPHELHCRLTTFIPQGPSVEWIRPARVVLSQHVHRDKSASHRIHVVGASRMYTPPTLAKSPMRRSKAMTEG